tara:strand:+ start:1788 stop:2654 length:867 start_codon:yes stop_codon:yes gene_type:complete
MKLALGTVQFGLDYGVANTAGMISDKDANNILKLANEQGVDTLDTAIGYGCSEERLGSLGVDGLKVVSKLPIFPDNKANVDFWIKTEVIASINRLRCSNLYGLLLHRASDLLGDYGSTIYSTLVKLKEQGFIKKIGVSIYDFDELNEILERYEVDLVQAPFSIVDRRLITKGLLDVMKSNGIEVHVRSVFLQGLLLMDVQDHDPYFSRWSNLWEKIDKWRSSNDLTALSSCLCYPLSIQGIDKVIVGVDSADHFSEILSASEALAPEISSDICSEDPDLINPSLWKTA